MKKYESYTKEQLIKEIHQLLETMQKSDGEKDNKLLLEEINKFAKLVNSEINIQDIIKAALEGIYQIIKPDISFLFTRDKDRLILQNVVPDKAKERLGIIPEHRVGQCLCGLAVEKGKPFYSKDIYSDSRCTWDECKNAGFKSFAALPVFKGGKPTAVIGIASDKERDFKQQDDFLKTITGQLSIALSNVLLQENLKKELEEHQKTEEALRLNEDKYHKLFENSNDGIIVHNLNGNILEANSKATVLLGYSKSELKRLKVQDLHFQEDIQKSSDAFKTIIREGSVKFEIDFKTRKNERLPTEVSSTIFKIGGKKIVMGLIRDISERKRSETALKESESLLRRIAENYPNSYISIIEKDYTVGFTSGQEFKKLNINPDSYVGMPLKEVFGEKFNFVREQYDKAFKGDEVSFELKINDQHQYYRAVPLIKEDRSIENILVVAENITERKTAEEKYRKLFENSYDGIILCDLKGQILDVNQKMIEYSGYSKQELLSLNIEDLHFSNDREKPAWNFETIVREGSVTFETVMSSKNGELLTFGVSSNFFEFSKNKVVMGILRDITGRKKAEEEIKKLSKIVEITSQSVIMTTIEGEVVYINKSYLNISHFKPAEVIGKSMFEFTDENGIKLLQEKTIPTLFEKGHWEGEINVRTKEDRFFPADMKCSLIISNKGEPEYFVAVFSDISKRKKAEEELLSYRSHLEKMVKKRTADLEDKNRELERLNNLFVGREFRIKELRDKVKELKKRLAEK